MSPLIRCSHARPAGLPAGHQDPARNTTPAHHARPADAKTPNPDEGSGCPQCPETSHGGAKDVELRGFEPLTFCMPCSRVSSDGVALRLVTAFQSDYRVWGGLARSGGIWGRWSLIWSWICRASRSTEIHHGNPEHRRRFRREGPLPGARCAVVGSRESCLDRLSLVI
jgi:hypothetical protein